MSKWDSTKLYNGISHIRPELIEEADFPAKKECHKAIWLKWCGRAAASFAAAVAILCSVNMVFPAFAEELPLIGGIFAQFNGRTGKDVPENVNQTVIDRAESVEASQTPTAEEASLVHIAVNEASCDGLVLNLAFSMTCTNDDLNNALATTFTQDTVAPDSNNPFVVTANGIEMESAMGNLPFFGRSEENKNLYTAVCSYYVPEKLRNADNLELVCSIPSLYVSTNAGETMTTLEEYSVPVKWESSFSVHVEPNYQVYTPHAELADGVVLQKVTLGVSVLDLEITMPAEMTARAIAIPLDGAGNPLDVIGYNTQKTDNGDGTQTCHVHMSYSALEGSSLTFQVIQWPAIDDVTEVLGSYTLELNK